MVDAVPVAILYLGPQCEILRANRRALALTDGAKTLEELATHEPWASARRLHEVVVTAGTDDFMEVEDEEVDRTWEITIGCSEAGEPGSTVLILREVTERSRLEEQLRRRDRLSAVGTLVYGMSHRLRSKLFGLTGLIDVLQAQIGEDPKLSPFLDLQRNQTRQIVELLNRLLQFAGPIEPHFTPGEIGPVIDIAASEARTTPEARNVGVDVNLDPALPRLDMDRDRLAIALRHLVQNAVEHTSEGGHVRVSGRVIRTERDEQICLQIEDEGSGIMPDYLPRVFEPFFTHSSDGQGLGLCIAQRIIEDHRGSIELSNRAQGGCRATVLLPVAPSARGAESEGD